MSLTIPQLTTQPHVVQRNASNLEALIVLIVPTILSKPDAPTTLAASNRSTRSVVFS
jgi:hypothetical protein